MKTIGTASPKAKVLLSAAKVLLAVIAFISLTNLLQRHTVNYVLVNQYVTSDVAYADGGTAHYDSKNFGRLNRGDTATLHLRLPQQPLMNNGTLVFYDFNAVTEVWCGDVLLDAYGEDVAAQGMMIGNHDFFIDVPDEAWGGEITIIVRATTNNAFANFTHLKIYPAQGAYRYYFDSDRAGFIVAITLLVIGVVGLFACLFGGFRSAARLNGLCLAALALLLSLWMISNKGLYGMFGLMAYFWQPLEYMAGYTIAIPVLLFYRGMTEKNSMWNKRFGFLALLIAAFFAVATVLNFTNVLHYDALVDVAGVLSLISGVLLIVYTLRMKPNGNRAQMLLRTGVFLFIPACLYEVLIRNIYRWIPLPFLHNLPTFMAVGILLLFACLVAAFISDLYAKQRNFLTAQIKAGLLDKVIATTPAGICQVIPDDRLTIVSANNTFYRTIGYTEDELAAGKPMDLMTHLTDEEKVFVLEKRDEILSRPQAAGEYELTTVDMENNPLTVLIRYFYDRHESGNVTINVVDITDRKRIEDELRVSEERYKLALKQSGKVFFFVDIPARTMRLPDELAQMLGLPCEVNNMLEVMLSQRIVEPDSVESCEQLYNQIIAGAPSGETVLCCHSPAAPEQRLWYKLAFTSVFDAQGVPQSAIVTYDDLQEQRAKEIAEAWKQQNLLALPETEYSVVEYNLTQNRLVHQTGGLFAPTPDDLTSYDEICAFALDHYVCEADAEGYRRFQDRQRLLSQFEAGVTEDAFEYRSLQHGATLRWTSTAIQMIRDPYSGDVLAQLLFRDINAERAGQMEMQQSMEELKKELENSRIKVMINQMQPHFLYNALSAIQTIVKTDPDYAYQLIYDFTVHLRSSIKALSSDAPIPFRDELKNIRAYLNIEQMRFDNSLRVNYEIDCDDFYVIPLSIQPLAENAARHGVYPKGDAGGTVTVRTYEAADAYVVEIEDDGVGFDVSTVMTGRSDSVGLKSLIFRLKSLMDANVAISSRIGAGTKVTVTIPKKDE